MPDDTGYRPHKFAKLFMHGGSQAVRLPKEFRFLGAEVAICREGDAVILEPVKRDWKAFWEEIDRRRGDELLELPPRMEWQDRDYDL